MTPSQPASTRTPRRVAHRRGARAAAAFASALACAAHDPAAGQGSQPAPPPAQAPAEAEAARNVTHPELAPFDGRLVSAVRFEGLSTISPQFVRNQLRTQEGRPFRAQTVTEDIQRLYRTGSFRRVDARVEVQPDLSVIVIFDLTEAKIIKDVQVVGNRELTDQQLAGVVNLLKGTPVDEFQLSRTRRAIEDLYRSKGYYLVRVTVDERELDDSGIILFRIREGDRLKVTDIRFVGNKSFDARELSQSLKTKTAGLFETGPLDNDALDEDVVSIVNFYRDRGYLDARADREITPSPDGKEAIVTFIIDEGPRYTLRRVLLRNAAGDDKPLVFSQPQIAGLMELKAGDVFGAAGLRKSIQAVQNAYWRLGYVDADVRHDELRNVEKPEIDLIVRVSEGRRFRAGEVVITGDDITRQNVIRRQIQVKPDRPLDRTALEESRLRLKATGLFKTPGPGDPSEGVKTTIQPEDPANPGYRDVLVEVKEHNTGSLSFGAAISSDSGVVGTVQLSQRNFDIADFPSSFGQLFSGRAFRGAGQTMDLLIAPGFEVQTYSVTLTDPAFLDTDYGISVGPYYRTRIYDNYSQDTLGGRASVARRFGDRWTGAITFRGENVKLYDIDSDAPVEYFASAGPSTIFGLGAVLTRTTVPPAERTGPTQGARTELGVEQVFGDYNFTKIRAQHELWLPVYQDFLGRKSVVSLRTALANIPQSGAAPIYETYYLGGRSFRGFEFQGVATRGVSATTGQISGDPVGGDWSFFAGIEFLQPIYGNVDGRAVISLVAFVDSGTVTNDIGFSDYRVSVGGGVRLLLPFSPVPLAFDLGYPILQQDRDQTQLFSFSVDLPF